MEISWVEHFELFGFAIGAALLAGIVCPLVGTFLYLRRTSFYGVALPQFATAGVVFGFLLLPWWVEHIGLAGLTIDQAFEDSHAALHYHLSWAALFTFGGLSALMYCSRRNMSEIGSVAAAFAIAHAATNIFGRVSPVGQAFVEELIHGEVLGVGIHEFETIALVFLLVCAVLVVYRRELILVSFDRDFAQVLGHHGARLELLLGVLTGLTVAVGTMTLCPTLLFGLLVLPPLAARLCARSMRTYLVLPSLFGLAAAVGGTLASFEFDLPMGAAIAAAAAALLIPAVGLSRWLR